ncbi:MAG: formate dehydrogenase accessory sulfurtransferase FdhD [Thermoleophilia bacterium]|nr:formate dehydrogenase accessory sulfurtransferase FdhD [Thermoleophilia bacterium]
MAVPAEEPVELLVDGRMVAVIHCTPLNLDELAVGYLLSQELIPEQTDVLCVRAEQGNRRVSVTLRHPPENDVAGSRAGTEAMTAKNQDPKPLVIYSGCAQRAYLAGRRGHMGDTIFGPAMVRAVLSRVLRKGELYRQTRGVHSAAIADANGEIMALREDIGRHNALDKILGFTAARGLDPGKLFIAATGRISADAVAKLIRFGIPLMLSRGVPTSLALSMAGETGISLVGSMGPAKLRVYSHPERLGIERGRDEPILI